MKYIKNSNDEIFIEIDGKDDYEKFLIDYNSQIQIDFLRIINLFDYDIVDMSVYNISKLELHMEEKPKYILPHKIKQLILLNTDENNSNYILTNLPTNLEYLEISIRYCFYGINLYPKLDYLPSSIKVLVLPGDYENNLENLPNSIKKIIFKKKIQRSRIYSNQQEIFHIDFSCLPYSIEQLKISNLFDYDKKIIKLPSKLEKLSFCSCLHRFNKLPDDYYSCFYELNNLIYLKTNIILPYELLYHLKKLKYLNFRFDGNDLKKIENILPNTLEYLSMNYNLCHFPNDIFEYDNKKLGLTELKNLKLKLISNKKKTITIKNLSKSLVSLTISLNIGEYNSNYNYNYNCLLEKLELEQIPESLEFLSIKSFENTLIDKNKISIKLPQGLKFLIYDKIKNNDNNDNIDYPNSLIYLETYLYQKSIQKLSNLQYLKINSSDKILDFQSNNNLTHLYLSMKINSINPYKIVFGKNLKVLLLTIDIEINDFDDLNINDYKMFENFNFSPILKVFGLNIRNLSKLSTDKFELLKTCITNNFRTILSKIPDSVEVLGFECFICDEISIPMNQFPKSLNKIYMVHRPSCFCYSFENHDIYSTIDNDIDEFRTESKRGEYPIVCMYNDYFHIKIIEYKKANKFWDEFFDCSEQNN